MVRHFHMTLMWQLAVAMAASYPRPGGWCGHRGSFYTNVDCDGDGRGDHVCRDNAGNFGAVYSRSRRGSWPKGVCQLWRKRKTGCPKPKGWCSHNGAKNTVKDCDGDFLPDQYCTDKKGNKGVLLSGLACHSTWPKAPVCNPPRARAITTGYALCGNRGGAGHNNKYSTNVGPYNLPACVAYVNGQSGCSKSFSYGVGDGWCDCVKTNVGAYNPRECVPHYDANKGFYTAYTIEGKSVTSPLNLVAENYLCENRGGVGGKKGMSKNVGAKNLKACAAWIKGNHKCGPFFNYGLLDGWCDCVPAGKGQCKYFTDAGTQKNKNSVYSQFSKTLNIGKSGGNKICQTFKETFECPSNAGNKGIRVNGDWRHAGDRFKITTEGKKVCARRLDSGGGWGMKLAITCAYKNIPKYQAKAMTTAPGHLCENRGSHGGKDKRYSKKIGPKKYVDCLKWVTKTKTCGHHFSYSWKHGWCDCVPKGQEFCKFYTDGAHINAMYSAYEIYTTTTTPPPPTPKPTPRPTPPKVKGLKSAKGWKVAKGFPSCTIDISEGVACVVSKNYPKKYSPEASCEIKMAKNVKRLDLHMKTEKWFDFLTIDGKHYHGTLKKKVDIKSKKLKWSADFFEEGSWKVCQASKKPMKVDIKKKKGGKK